MSENGGVSEHSSHPTSASNLSAHTTAESSCTGSAAADATVLPSPPPPHSRAHKYNLRRGRGVRSAQRSDAIYSIAQLADASQQEALSQSTKCADSLQNTGMKCAVEAVECLATALDCENTESDVKTLKSLENQKMTEKVVDLFQNTSESECYYSAQE